jgi:cell division septation protein DedD
MANNHDDSFREIQLGGKQLVFLFMAVVVIGVTIFLSGVMVGRGVLAARGPAGVESTVAAAEEADPAPPPASATPGTSTTPATASEKLSYAERLGSGEPPTEPLKPEASTPAEPPSPKAEAAPAPATPEPTPAPAPPPAPAPAEPAPKPAPKAAEVSKAAEPAGAGFAIQVAALRVPGEADAIVKRLAGKGYPAYVVTPPKGSAPIYRVRVGKFKERREADTVAARLQKEEQFKPWIVR